MNTSILKKLLENKCSLLVGVALQAVTDDYCQTLRQHIILKNISVYYRGWFVVKYIPLYYSYNEPTGINNFYMIQQILTKFLNTKTHHNSLIRKGFVHFESLNNKIVFSTVFLAKY